MARPTRRIPQSRAMIVTPQPGSAEAAHACALTQGVVDPLMCGINRATRDHLMIDGFSAGPHAYTETIWEDAFERELDAIGHDVRRTAATSPFGAVQGITMWDQRLEGGADPRRSGLAASVA